MPFLKKATKKLRDITHLGGASSAAQNSLAPTTREEYSEEATQALWEAIEQMKCKTQKDEESFIDQKIRPLIENSKPNVNYQNEKGETVLHCAMRKCWKRVVEFLIKEGGADVTIVDNDQKNILHLAISALPRYLLDKKRADFIRLLLDRGIHPDAPDCFGDVVLGDAVFYRCDDIVELLLDRGASINRQTEENKLSALHRAILLGSKDMVDFLISKGADLSLKDKKGSDFIGFAKRNSPRLVEHIEKHMRAAQKPTCS